MHPALRYGLKDATGLLPAFYADLAEARREALALLYSRTDESQVELVSIAPGGIKTIWVLSRNRNRRWGHGSSWKQVTADN